MATPKNGRDIAVKILIGVVLLLVGGGATLAFGHSRSVDKKQTKAVAAVAADLDTHEDIPGHPVLVERVDTMQATVNEIRSDVKILLRRTP